MKTKDELLCIKYYLFGFTIIFIFSMFIICAFNKNQQETINKLWTEGQFTEVRLKHLEDKQITINFTDTTYKDGWTTECIENTTIKKDNKLNSGICVKDCLNISHDCAVGFDNDFFYYLCDAKAKENIKVIPNNCIKNCTKYWNEQTCTKYTLVKIKNETIGDKR